MAKLAKRHVHTDTNGRHPTAGDTVIANVSGTLRKGIVKGVGARSRRDPEVGHGTIHVELIDQTARGYWDKHVSKIKDPTSVFVVRPGDAPPLVHRETAADYNTNLDRS